MAEPPQANVTTFEGSTHQPTAFHRQFVGSGRRVIQVAAPFVRFDFPERLILPNSRPVLFAGNHRSLFDLFASMAIFAHFGASSRLLIRADYVQKGPAGPFLRSIGSIPASPETRQQAEDAAVAALEAGELVSLMPEGRLVRPEDWRETGVGPARPGVSRIAKRAGALVQPVAIVGTEKVWPRGSWPRPRLGRTTVRVRLGQPVEMVGDDDEANTEALMAHLGELVRSTEVTQG